MSAEPETIGTLATALQARQVSSLEVTNACLDAIAGRDGAINAFIHVCADDARTRASAADREIAAGRHRGPLHGVPLSLKDLLDLEGVPTTAASKVRQGHIAAADARVVAALRSAGAVFVGKTNLHEFAMGTTNEDSAYGPVHHPLDPTRSPGGSSGGSAASILAGMAYASIGSDTGGSIRIPAAACGLVGLKPAYGDLPLDGVVPLCVSLDHLGPLCRSVEDAAIVYRAMRGEPDWRPPVGSLSGVTLGVLRGYFTARLDADVAERFEETCERLSRAGARLEEASIPHAGEIGAVYMLLTLPEAAAVHAQTLTARPQDYTANVRGRLQMARYILAEDHVRARRGQAVLTAEVDAALAGRSGLLLPSMPIPATRLGASTVMVAGVEEPVRNMTLRLTQLFNITGHPAISLPCGLTSQGLPVGLQLVGHARRTVDLLALAATAEPHVSIAPPRSN
jgi:aspartyl-tRNA(Asn)/glutamyl-tRNA(Gln) amidotransferase subunit A